MELAVISCTMRMNHTLRHRDDSRGFTIVELMIVIVVMTVLTTMSLPAFTSWLAGYRLKEAAGEIFSALHLAKSTALKENSDVVIWFNTANNTYLAYLDNGAGGGTPGNQTQDGGEETIKNGTLQAGVDMYSTVFSTWSNQTYFNSRGLAEGGWGSVLFKSDGYDKYRRITVWTTGHIKLETSINGATWN